jgi:hypothetical protein
MSESSFEEAISESAATDEAIEERLNASESSYEAGDEISGSVVGGVARLCTICVVCNRV